jgi:hypothetical protein
MAWAVMIVWPQYTLITDPTNCDLMRFLGFPFRSEKCFADRTESALSSLPIIIITIRHVDRLGR